MKNASVVKPRSTEEKNVANVRNGTANGKTAKSSLEWLEAMPETEQSTSKSAESQQSKLTINMDISLSILSWPTIKVMAERRGWTVREMVEQLLEDGADNYEFRQRASDESRKRWNDATVAERKKLAAEIEAEAKK